MTERVTLADVIAADEKAQEAMSQYIRQNVPTETLVGILIDRPECRTFHTALADGKGISLNAEQHTGNLIAIVIDRDKEAKQWT